MKILKTIKYSEMKELLETNSLEVISNISINENFSSIKTILKSDKNDLSFFSNKKYLNDLKKTKAKACFIEHEFVKYLPKNCKPIIVNDPYLALAIVSNIFNDENFKSNGEISNNSLVDQESKIHKNVQINAFSIIDKKTEVHENVYIGSNTSIGPNVIIYKDVIIHDNVTISNAIIKENCVIKSGTRIGGSGFGFEMKTKKKIHHTGNVIIGKNSSIGSNTTIDRAVFDSTVIGDFSNIDNLVQIAHNVTIGDYAVIAAQVGVAGSTNIGKYVKIGGQAGISGHLLIGDNVTIAAKSGVTKNIQNNKTIAGFPAKDINLWKKEIIKNSIKK